MQIYYLKSLSEDKFFRRKYKMKKIQFKEMKENIFSFVGKVKDLDKYILQGVMDDHECSNISEAKEKIKKG